jgi:acetylglutamate synthase
MKPNQKTKMIAVIASENYEDQGILTREGSLAALGEDLKNAFDSM